MVDIHPFVTTGGTWKEADALLKELRERQIRNHISLAKADDEIKEKVKRVLEDLRIALDKIQKEIRSNVDMPGSRYNPKTVDNLRLRQRQLRGVQDELLNVVGR